MIAASPRSQDIRRIAPMSESAYHGYRGALFFGMPMAVFVAGCVVFVMRRRG